jgi:hypothetical protein
LNKPWGGLFDVNQLVADFHIVGGTALTIGTVYVKMGNVNPGVLLTRLEWGSRFPPDSDKLLRIE